MFKTFCMLVYNNFVNLSLRLFELLSKSYCLRKNPTKPRRRKSVGKLFSKLKEIGWINTMKLSQQQINLLILTNTHFTQ